MAGDQARLPRGAGRLRVVPAEDDPNAEAPARLTPVRPGPPRRSRVARILVVLLLVAAAGVGTAALTHRWPFAPAGVSRPLRLVATLPFWNIPRDIGKVLADRADISEVTPWLYGIDAGGGVVAMGTAVQRAAVEEALAKARDAGLAIVPTIANVRDGAWDYPTVIAVLRDPARRARQIQQIVALARANDYPGVDIDYENFRSADRPVFSGYVRELAAALHADGRTLSVDLFAKATDSGYDQRNVAQDYRAVGRAADSVRLMAYDWHWSASEPGPIAPISWVQEVLAYALTQIPREKIVLGVPAYGYDWVGDRGELVSWLQTYGFQQRYGAEVRWDARSQSPWLTYRTADGTQHVVWFENAYSAEIKLALAKYKGIGGAYLWLAGDEDDLLWQWLSASSIATATSRLLANGTLGRAP